jgi:hypothetical protein
MISRSPARKKEKARTRQMMTKMTMVPFALLLTFSLGLAPRNSTSEVWSIDQSESAGKNYGGTIYIWDSKDLEKVNKEAVAEKVDLGGAASALCLAQTGANPVRHRLFRGQWPRSVHEYSNPPADQLYSHVARLHQCPSSASVFPFAR